MPGLSYYGINLLKSNSNESFSEFLVVSFLTKKSKMDIEYKGGVLTYNGFYTILILPDSSRLNIQACSDSPKLF